MLFADDPSVTFQHKDITENETALNKIFSVLCDWLVDNELSIYFNEGKTKSILFTSKNKIKNSKLLNIQYNDVKIKQYSKATYIDYILHETLS